VHWKGRHIRRLPRRLEGRVLVDQVSAEDKQSLQKIIGHVGPGEVHDVILDGSLTMACSSYGNPGLASDGLDDTISTITKVYWEGRAYYKMGPIL
jgi:hypothetical protein